MLLKVAAHGLVDDISVISNCTTKVVTEKKGILRSLFHVYCTDSIKMGTERVFSYQQKLSYLLLQDIRALKLISLSTKF